MTPKNPVTTATLPNGLKIIVRESHDAPLASFWTWYRVGSRNEQPGLTGVSHWVEHMQFKGTDTLAKGAVFGEVSRNGGTLNAMTSYDWTAYYETLPVDRLDLSLRIESDRMVNSLYDPEETESERTVILSERQGSENSPAYLLHEEVTGTAFHAHPYGHSIIGYEADLRRISRDDLYHHYQSAYRPDNAYIVAVGDFDAAELVGRIEAAFGGIAAGATLPPVTAAEPPQLAERRVILRHPAPTPVLQMAYKTPEAKHPDAVALMVARAVLSGAGGGMGRSSRLYRAFVASGRTRSAGCGMSLSLDPFLMSFSADLLPGGDLAGIEGGMEEEIERLKSTPVGAEELARAIKGMKAQQVYAAEGATNQAYWLGFMEAVDRWERADDLIERIERVTPEDIQRVATTWLVPERRTVGWLVPTGDGGGADRPAPVNPNVWGIGGPGAPTPATRLPYQREELPNGIVVLGHPHPADPSVSVTLRFEAGTLQDPDERGGTAALVGRLLDRGTAGHTFEELVERTDALGAAMGVQAGPAFTDLSIRCLTEDLATLLDLAREVMRTPTFPEDELDKMRQQFLASLRQQDQDTGYQASFTRTTLLYPAGHPMARRQLGTPESLARIGREDLARFHAERFGPKVMTVSAVGGFPDFAHVTGLVAERFGDWTAPATPPPPDSHLQTPAGVHRTDVPVDGKSQADIAIGSFAPPRSHPAWQAFEIGNLILGRLGLMGRLGANVRDRQGLAYHVSSSIAPARVNSTWGASAGVAPENIDRAIESILDEVRTIRAEMVTDEEISDAKSYLTGSLPLALESNDGVAGLLLTIERFGLGLDYLDRYPGLVNAVTREEVREGMQLLLDPANLAIGVGRPA